MKNAKWMLPVIMLLLPGMMTAQSLTNWTVAAQVPFEFVANNRIIPAGHCVVKSSSLDSGGQVLAIGNFSAHKSLLAQPGRAESKTVSGKTVMVFKHYGDRYFLSSIRIQGSNLIYKLPESRAEVELRAQNVAASQMNLVAAVR
jgi:hypothetical protein